MPLTPLRIWLCCVGEYLPTDPGQQRQLRMSLLAQTLHARGHDVTWWASTYDHEAKRLRADTDTAIPHAPRYTVQLLHGRPYRRNVSIDRLRNHAEVARAFLRRSDGLAPPDLVLATVPTVEFAAAAARYCGLHDVPLVIDVRDQHPDIYLSLAPRPFRSLARLALAPLYRDLDGALQRAAAITASSETFLAWALHHADRPRAERDAVFPLAYPDLVVDPAERAGSGSALRALGVDPARKNVWYIGTFNRWIDLGTAIRAARLIAGRGRHDVTFVFSGDGDHAAQWRREAEGLPNVVFTGWVRSAAIAWLRDAAWVGLAPYREGFTTMGNKLFEFMAGGLPVVFSLEGEPRRVIEATGAGLHFPAGNAEALAAALLRLADDAALHERLGAAGRGAYEANWRADVVYPRMAAHLETVAGRHGR
jgi:glycosyltransferase involved in cell wall biosynthesis